MGIEEHLARRDVANQLGQSGDFRGAVEALSRLIADLSEEADYSLKLYCRADLAQWRGRDGALADAVADLRVLVPELEQVYGPDHGVTLQSRHTLVEWSWQPGAGVNAREAVIAWEQLLNDERSALGPEDPNARRSAEMLAYWRSLADGAQAEDAIARLEAAGRLGAADNIQGAIEALENLLRDLGEDSDDQLRVQCRRDLAMWRGRGGDVSGAVADYREVVPELQRVFGPDHLLTMLSRHDLVQWGTGPGSGIDADTAVAEWEQLLADERRVFPLDDPLTRHAAEMVRYWQATRYREKQDAGRGEQVQRWGVVAGVEHVQDDGGQFHF